MNRFTYLESPIGPLLLACDGEALTGLYMDVPEHSPRDLGGWVRGCGRGSAAGGRAAIRTSISRARGASSICRCASRARNFSGGCGGSLTEIRYGETWSYGELARRIGNPNASRAVGLANGRNPISIIVPCHRVIGADGSLTGYGGGLERKRWLLAHEGLHLAFKCHERLSSDRERSAPPPSGRLAGARRCRREIRR